MDKKWIETVSKLQTYEISPFEINKCIIEFAKAILQLANEKPNVKPAVSERIGLRTGFPSTKGELIEEEDQSTLDFIDESLPPSMQE